MIAHRLLGKWLLGSVAALLIAGISIDSLTAEGKLPEDSHAERKGVGILPLDDVEAIGDRLKGDPAPLPPLEIDIDRSLFIHDKALLAGISFEAIMDQLAASSGLGADSGEALFKQWWRTLGEGTDAEAQQRLVCSSPGFGTTTTANGFVIDCDEQLALLSGLGAPFGVDGAASNFIVIGAANRGDLMPNTGPVTPNCGEYRLIAAADPLWTTLPDPSPETPTRVLMIFESTVPGGPETCRAIQKFWASLSSLPSDAEVADALRRFFLVGGAITPEGLLLPPESSVLGAIPIGPAMTATNLGGDPAHRRGQIRTNTLTDQTWIFREFEFREVAGKLRLLVTPLDGSPDPSLFSGTASMSPGLVAAINASPSLFEPNINRFSFLPANTGMEASQMLVPLVGSAKDGLSYQQTLGPAPGATGAPPPGDNIVRDAIVALTGAGSSLAFHQLVRRIEVLSCAGCHRHVRAADGFIDDDGRPMKWTGPTDFTHITETATPSGRYQLSDTLTCILLPHRERVMRAFLGSPPDPVPATTPEDCARLYNP